MKLIARSKSSGKTTALLEWLREPTDPDEVRVFVALSPQRAMAVLAQERADAERDDRPPLESWRFVCLDEALSRRCWRTISGTIVVGLDDIDLILGSLLRRSIGAMTLTTTTKLYSIPACDVVTGMLLAPGLPIIRVGEGPSPIGHQVRITWQDQGVKYGDDFDPGALVDVVLPGPSPRDLLPHLADELRLWPEPLHGRPWQWDHQDGFVEGRWFTVHGAEVVIDHGQLVGKEDALCCFLLDEEPNT